MPTSSLLRLALHPPPKVGKTDTSLRYTDILFGFVIKELFLRLQHWTALDAVGRLHLVTGTTLVLGSWIGYRRSTHRPQYEVMFFNLPFFRFLADQLMLVIYFRMAVLTKEDGQLVVSSDNLASHSTYLLTLVFCVYLVWDLLGIRMATAEDTNSQLRYTKPTKDSERGTDQLDVNWEGALITLVCLLLLVLTYFSALHDTFSRVNTLLSAIAILLLYRLLKEFRTSWKTSP
jgi:hypothetical protein